MEECVGFIKDLANTHWVIGALAAQQVVPGKIVRTLGSYTSTREGLPSFDYWNITFKRNIDNHTMEFSVSAQLASLTEREECEPFGAPYTRISCVAEDASILVEALIAMLGGGKIDGCRSKQWVNVPSSANQEWIERIPDERAFAIRIVDTLGSAGLELINKIKIDERTLSQLKSVVSDVAPLRMDNERSQIYEEVR